MKIVQLLFASALLFEAHAQLSPTAIVATANGETIFVAAATANKILLVDAATGKTKGSAAVAASPIGLALTPGDRLLIVTSAGPESRVSVLDTATLKMVRSFAAGHNAQAPVLSRDGKTLFVCNRFNNEIAFIDFDSGKTVKRVPVLREPVAQALTLDGKYLLVANHIHGGRSDLNVVASCVSVIDVAAARLVKNIDLPNGSGLLRGIALSPDGKFAAVTHLLSRFHLPTTQIERGWINNNAISIIDVESLDRLNTVLLDNIDSGAANPWAVAWNADGKRLLVTHAGTHEVSVIDAPALLAKLARMPKEKDPNAKVDYTVASRIAADVPNDLAFTVGLRQRVKLPPSDRGPRALAIVGARAYVANYFSDTLSRFDFNCDRPQVESLTLGPKAEMTAVRKGEFYFNDATICFQGWQSCASCHSSDARVDGLNWDNLNDGIGNPKNVKSMLLAHQTPPSMALGVRADAYVSVRAGIKNSLFTVQPEEVAASIDEYLKSLKPEASPYLENGKLSPAARRGKNMFDSERVGCTECHKPPLFTDLKLHDIGTRSQYDKPTDKFDTPTLVEIWRSAPYLHDGSAATVRDVLTNRNGPGKHGDVRGLTPSQIDDLVAYVMSL
jgi:DNA-binding beta-propeller fold protein YncE